MPPMAINPGETQGWRGICVPPPPQPPVTQSSWLWWFQHPWAPYPQGQECSSHIPASPSLTVWNEVTCYMPVTHSIVPQMQTSLSTHRWFEVLPRPLSNGRKNKIYSSRTHTLDPGMSLITIPSGGRVGPPCESTETNRSFATNQQTS